MDIIEYTAKDKEKRRAIDAISLVNEMEQLEKWHGTTESRLVENWYEIKNRLANAIVVEKEQDVKPNS
jgi:hypothetical protein